MSLEGRIALVTGASRGIGKTVAEHLATAGAKVVVSARSEGPLKEVAEAIGGVAVPMDVADPASVEAGLSGIARDVGRVDVLVPNAGIADSAPFHRTTDAMWERMMAVNATSVLRICRALVPPMVDAGWGRVVIIASNAGLGGYAYTSAYCASKHAVIGFMRGAALELGTSGVTMNAVCPGWVDTPMTDQTIARIEDKTGRSREDAIGSLTKMSPQRRLMTTEEIASTVTMLCGEGARGIHGQAIAIDGGQTMK